MDVDPEEVVDEDAEEGTLFISNENGEIIRPSSRSSVKRVSNAISKMSAEKKKIIEQIFFGGLLKLPQLNKVDRGFTFWLLNQVDCSGSKFVVNDREIKMEAADVERILGIPRGMNVVRGLGTDDPEKKFHFIQYTIGAEEDEANSLKAARMNVEEEYEEAMTAREISCFKVSFVVYVLGYFLAPTTKVNHGSNAFWGALLNPEEIPDYNWCQYVLDMLIESARKAQLDMQTKKKCSNVTGCPLLLQMMFLDKINLGLLNRPIGIRPWVYGLTCELMRRMTVVAGNVNLDSKVVRANEQVDMQFASSRYQAACPPGLGQGVRGYLPPNPLGEFISSIKPGKLTSSQLTALKLFNARVLLHTNHMKMQIQRDTVSLVKTLCIDYVPEQSISTQSAASSSVRANHLKETAIYKRQDTGEHNAEERKGMSVGCSSKTHPVTNLLLSTPKSADQHQNAKGDPVMNDQSSFKTPIHPMTKLTLGTPASNLTEYFSFITPAHPIRHLTLDPSPKANNILFLDNMLTPVKDTHTTPAHGLLPSSPKTVTKLFNEAALFGRLIVDEDDELNLNATDPQCDFTTSPLMKRDLTEGRMAKSPWVIRIQHPQPEEELAATLWRWLPRADKSELMRRLRQLDGEMYSNRKSPRWRHLVESDFAVLCLAGEDPLQSKSVREQFIGENINYDINQCRMVGIKNCFDNAVHKKSGILTVMVVRDFDGTNIATPGSQDWESAIQKFKTNLLYEILATKGNCAKLPVAFIESVED
uniref:Aminotransferase-like plant mobile domain-containing protein n=1 Tax=Oryza punctata TaxID=4537 RepID=A0A0E0JIA0_ORYPU